MTRERTRELLPVIQAFAEGKTIQDNVNGTWIDSDSPCWGQNGEWRVKPEPREFWLVPTCSSSVRFLVWLSKPSDDIGSGVIHVREVL